MPGIKAMTLTVSDPSAVAQRLAEAFSWTVAQDFGAFAEVSAGGETLIWLNVPSTPTTTVQHGVIIHVEVEDVTRAAEQARSAGATILREPTEMDFGMESALAQVEGGPIVDLCRPL